MKDVVRLVCLPHNQRRLYEEHLTDDEQAALFEFLPSDKAEADAARLRDGRAIFPSSQAQEFVGNGFRNVNRLAEMRNTMPEQLFLDLAYEFGVLVNQPEYDRLTRHFCGEDRHAPTNSICYSAGELRLNGTLARKVKESVSKKTRIEQILDSFQEVGWKRSRMSFESILGEEETLQSAVRDLNKGLKGMRFMSHNRGKEVSWKIEL